MRNTSSESLTIEANVPGDLHVHTVTNKSANARSPLGVGPR